MPNLNYLAGRRFEYARMKFWRERGYSVLRTAGSHGAWDLILVPCTNSARKIILVQCKVVKTYAKALALINKFKGTSQSMNYHQRLEVYVRDTREIAGWEL